LEKSGGGRLWKVGIDLALRKHQKVEAVSENILTLFEILVQDRQHLPQSIMLQNMQPPSREHQKAEAISEVPN
jgi:hypothetical protein